MKNQYFGKINNEQIKIYSTNCQFCKYQNSEDIRRAHYHALSTLTLQLRSRVKIANAKSMNNNSRKLSIY